MGAPVWDKPATECTECDATIPAQPATVGAIRKLCDDCRWARASSRDGSTYLTTRVHVQCRTCWERYYREGNDLDTPFVCAACRLQMADFAIPVAPDMDDHPGCSLTESDLWTLYEGSK